MMIYANDVSRLDPTFMHKILLLSISEDVVEGSGDDLFNVPEKASDLCAVRNYAIACKSSLITA